MVLCLILPSQLNGWTTRFQIIHSLMCYFSPLFFVLLCVFKKPGRFLPVSPGTTGARFPCSLCSGISPGTGREDVCVLINFHCFFWKRGLKSAPGRGAQLQRFLRAPVMPLRLPRSFLLACRVSCLPAWLSSAPGVPLAPSRIHPCRLHAGKPRGLPHTAEGWMHLGGCCHCCRFSPEGFAFHLEEL